MAAAAPIKNHPETLGAGEKKPLPGDDDLPRCRRENGKFVSPWGRFDVSGPAKSSQESDQEPLTFGKKLRFMRNMNKPVASKEELERELPILKPDFALLNTPENNGVRMTWIGHATCLVQMENITFLTDPIFSNYCSPVQGFGPKRYRAPPCKVEDLPKIDAVVLSHTHYDHCDHNTIKALNRRFGAELTWFVPLGHKNWMKGVGCKTVHELDWWEEASFEGNPEVKFVYTPTKHWSQRTLWNSHEALWGSWCVIGPHQRFYFAGDTAYCDVFKIIGRKYGPFDLAAIPIGAYEPRAFMEPVHVDPVQAVQIHADIEAKKSLGIHWATFKLSVEPYLDPPVKAREAMAKNGLPIEDFFTLKHGETRSVGNQ